MARTPKTVEIKPAANMMAPSKKMTPKMLAAQKALAERTGGTAKKATPAKKKAVAKKVPVKKTVAKKATAKKPAAKKVTATKKKVATAAGKSTAKAATAKATKPAAKKPATKAATAKKRAAAKKTTGRATTKASIAKKPAVKKTTAAKPSTTAKKTATKTAASKKASTTKKAPAKKLVAKKAVAGKAASSKSKAKPSAKTQSAAKAPRRGAASKSTAKPNGLDVAITQAEIAEASARETPFETAYTEPETTVSAKGVSGYGTGGVETVISVEEVTRQVAAIAQDITPEHLDSLVGGDAYVSIENLRAGYGKMEILHDINLRVGRKQSLCLIGPNGAGKSTVLHAIFGFNNIFSGAIKVGDGADKRDVTKLSPNEKLGEAGIAYILQDKSVFPGMTVEENLWMGGFLKDQPAEAKRAAEMIFDKYPRLAARRKHQAKVLSGGERRLLEISRALVMDPEILLVDEPSIGLEPRFIDMVFEILHGLQHDDGKTIIMVEQNAKKGLEFADIGYVLVSGEIAIAGTGDELLANPNVGQLFLGG